MAFRARMLTLLTILGVHCILGGTIAFGQKKTDDSPGRLPPEGSDKLVKAYNDKGSDFRAMAKGERAATKSDLELIDLGAKYFVYRLTWREQTKAPGSATLLINQTEAVVSEAIRSKGKAAVFQEMFGRQLGIRIKELLSHDDLLVRMNASLLLAVAARTGTADLAPILTEAIQDDRQAAGVRYWAVQAARELLAYGRQANLRMRPDQEEPLIAALVAYLEHAPDFPERIVRVQLQLADPKSRDSVSPEDRKEVTQYEGGIQLARRAAAKALGESRLPGLLKRAEGRNVADEKALTALALGRLVAGDTQALVRVDPKVKAKGIAPRAAVGEQVEAAIALCQLQSTLMTDYNPDYAAHHVGRFLVEFANRSNNERSEKQEPWRQHAARMLAAFDELAKDLKRRTPSTDAGTRYCNDLITHATPVLKSVEAGAQAGTDNLLRWLGSAECPSKSMYKTLPTATVTPRNQDL